MALGQQAACDEQFMRLALELAQSRLGLTSPNPAVGCVVVRRGQVVACAATAQGGRPHAETQALAAAGPRARGATAYVSLEPCAHYGQTPPCAKSLLEAGVGRVVIGCVDPFPAVRGRGLGMLKRAGIATTVGVLEPECRRLNEGFFTRVSRGRPFGLLKLALTLDGRIATGSGDSKWISSPQARELVHRWRAESDAVMVGAGTVAADNPRLTCRIARGRDPVRIIIDPRLRTRPDARVYRERSNAPAILVTVQERLAAAKRLHGANTEVIALAEKNGRLQLARLMRSFGRRGWSRVLLEGGAHLAAAALEARIVDRVAFFVAPKIVGGGLSAIEGLHISRMQRALKLHNLRARAVGPDLLVEADLD